MASVDQGASQRRGGETSLTPINQGSSLSPAENYGESYFTNTIGAMDSDDNGATHASRVLASKFSKLAATTSVESADVGSVYMQPFVGLIDGFDRRSTAARQKSTIARIGIDSLGIETSDKGTSYATNKVGSLSPYILVATTVYKLQAWDNTCVPPRSVQWLSTTVSLAQAPVSPCGGPLQNLSILDQF